MFLAFVFSAFTISILGLSDVNNVSAFAQDRDIPRSRFCDILDQEQYTLPDINDEIIIAEPIVTPDDIVRPAYCSKFGVNPAGYQLSQNDYSRLKKIGAGYSLILVNEPSEIDSAVNQANAICQAGAKPVLRLCLKDRSCGFGRENESAISGVYIDFLTNLSNRSANCGEIFVTAGPNEPLTEAWTTGEFKDVLGTYLADVQGNKANIDSFVDNLAKSLTDYSTAVVNWRNSNSAGQKIKVISPVFNVTNPYFGELIRKMREYGANFANFDCVGVNTYRTQSEKVNATLDNVVFPSFYDAKGICITETGLYSISQQQFGASCDQTKETYNRAICDQNVTIFKNEEISKLQTDDRIRMVLFFNGFGNNPDVNFNYGALPDERFRELLGAECVAR